MSWICTIPPLTINTSASPTIAFASFKVYPPTYLQVHLSKPLPAHQYHNHYIQCKYVYEYVLDHTLQLSIGEYHCSPPIGVPPDGGLSSTKNHLP